MKIPAISLGRTLSLPCLLTALTLSLASPAPVDEDLDCQGTATGGNRDWTLVCTNNFCSESCEIVSWTETFEQPEGWVYYYYMCACNYSGPQPDCCKLIISDWYSIPNPEIGTRTPAVPRLPLARGSCGAAGCPAETGSCELIKTATSAHAACI